MKTSWVSRASLQNKRLAVPTPLATQVHPDKNPGDDQATPAFQFLQQAFSELKAIMHYPLKH